MNMLVKPLISIMIPLYNHSRYVKRCLDSVLECGYPRIEIVIIDDGSTDDSFAHAQQWSKEKNQQLLERFDIESRPNKGITRTLNELITKSRGDYLVLLASDDFLIEGGIEARLNYLQQHCGKLAVFGDCIVVDDCGKKIHDSAIVDLYGGHISCLQDDKMIALELIFNWCVTGPGFMARRELYDRIGYYDESLAVEDWDMYLRIAAQGMLGFIPDKVAAYRYHCANSILNSSTLLSRQDSLKRTAIKNFRAFHGIERYGLLYQYFSLKRNIATLNGHLVKAFICRRIAKFLRIFSVKQYKKIITHLPQITQANYISLR